MTYDEALQQLRQAAAERGLMIKTYCLVYLGCETVPQAVEKLTNPQHYEAKIHNPDGN